MKKEKNETRKTSSRLTATATATFEASVKCKDMDNVSVRSFDDALQEKKKKTTKQIEFNNQFHNILHFTPISHMKTHTHTHTLNL